jgi:glycosyltransferase involved in cell wall biosynthesis
MPTSAETLRVRDQSGPTTSRRHVHMRLRAPGSHPSAFRRSLRVGIIAPPWIPIPPPSYGGIEQVIAMLAGGLVRRGHEVTLVAAPGSHVEGAHIVSPLPDVPPAIGGALDEWQHLAKALEEVAGCDVVIDHSGPLGALLTSNGGPPALHVVHGPVDQLRTVYRTVAGRSADLRLLAISHAQVRLAPDLPFAGVCRNAVDIDNIPFQTQPDPEPYLAFLGRICPDKGVAAAIRIARRAGMQLRIAAKCRERAERDHFAEVVEPELGDDVVYLGEVGAEEKFDLLGGARALVFPIDWEEPFGLVMAESMACGTPVLATRRGAAPEVVEDGVGGFVRDDENALVEVIGRLDEIDRERCRDRIATNFSLEAMTSAYESVMHTAVAAPPRRPAVAASL